MVLRGNAGWYGVRHEKWVAKTGAFVKKECDIGRIQGFGQVRPEALEMTRQ